ncbi:MAG: hypothetical protein QGH45_03815, partial [Myxococcota bacterium]|nr:hypothetical protein [Myxococcota bacterium]
MRRAPVLVLATAALLTALPAAADTLVVDPSDPLAYATIGEAVTDAVSGDVIEVAAGTYAESVVFGGKDLELIGVDGFAATYIDGPADAIHVDGAGASVVRGFNVRSAGRGIVAVNV